MRRPKYNESLKDRIVLLAEKGLTNKEICQSIDIQQGTLYRWLNEKKELSDALKRAKEKPDLEVEGALYRRAIGYEYTEVHGVPDPKDNSKTIVSRVIRKQMPGDVTAQIFWLKNRKKEVWRDTYRMQNEGVPTDELDLSSLSYDELRNLGAKIGVFNDKAGTRPEDS